MKTYYYKKRNTNKDSQYPEEERMQLRISRKYKNIDLQHCVLCTITAREIHGHTTTPRHS